MTVSDKRAPMPSAPMRYAPDGSVDWGDMWTEFCVLAQDGGPPHRGTMLHADESSDPNDPAYQAVVAEIIRGIHAVSGLSAIAASPGWIAVRCESAGMAHWLREAIEQENVQARTDDALLLAPAGTFYAVEGEIKNVITAVAKTTHYWGEHLPAEVKRTLDIQMSLERLQRRLFGWLRFGRGA